METHSHMCIFHCPLPCSTLLFLATDFSLFTFPSHTKAAEVFSNAKKMPSNSTLLNHFQPINADDSHGDLACDEERPLDFDSPETFFDLPPDSFYLPESHEQDWFHRNAVMERKRSMKFSFPGNLNHHPKSFSSRFWPSVNQKTNQQLIGPLKTQKSCLVDGNSRRNKAGIARLFRSRSEPGGLLVLEVSEPGSPRVSCMGRVAIEAATGTQRAKRIGFWRSFKSIFGSRSQAKPVADNGSTGLA